MSNMSYCRFQNTLQDLQDCYNHIDDARDLSPDETIAKKRLIELCQEIAEYAEREEEYENSIGMPE